MNAANWVSVIPGPQKGYVEKVRCLNAERFGNGQWFQQSSVVISFSLAFFGGTAQGRPLTTPFFRRGNERGEPVPRYFS